MRNIVIILACGVAAALAFTLYTARAEDPSWVIAAATVTTDGDVIDTDYFSYGGHVLALDSEAECEEALADLAEDIEAAVDGLKATLDAGLNVVVSCAPAPDSE